MTSAVNAKRSANPLSTSAPNPFAFNPSDAQKQRQKNTVEYISPEKRKNMKEYLSNSSINLSNGAEKHFSSQQQFQSSNQALLKKHTDRPSGEQLRDARDTNKSQQRIPHVWMGRDNEFRSYTRREMAIVGKNHSAYNNDMAAVLRKHNFSFGFEIYD